MGAGDTAIAGEPPALLVRGLRKRYGELVAVDGLDLEAARGTCLGLLGPNGAGKTTTIEILEGLKQADEGEVLILGSSWSQAPQAIRVAIGVQLQETQFDDKLTVLEVLRLFRSFYPRGLELNHVLDLVGLEEKRAARVGKLSGGQKQRLALGCALINDPSILFLDEPTTGLDPQARRRVWEIVEDFKSRGGTVLLTTHYMEEAERLTDDLAIIDRGRAIARGSPTSIIASMEAEGVIEFQLVSGPEVSQEELAHLTGVMDARLDGKFWRLSVTDAQRSLAALFDFFRSRGYECDDLRTHRPTLEDVFVSLTGKHLRDG